MNLPSRPLVEFMRKRFSTRKNWRVNFMMDLPSGLGENFEAIFYEKKVVRQLFENTIFKMRKYKCIVSEFK